MSLYCKKCQRDVDESETSIYGKIDKFERWPDDGTGRGSERMTFAMCQHNECGGEVIDRASVEGVKKALHPEQ
ncbi:hypothetical protein KGM48_02800 [Patescibacteria group bacterium]|nr:hypothetical protein [Patescibacteria group bacterium]